MFMPTVGLLSEWVVLCVLVMYPQMTACRIVRAALGSSTALTLLTFSSPVYLPFHCVWTRCWQLCWRWGISQQIPTPNSSHNAQTVLQQAHLKIDTFSQGSAHIHVYTYSAGTYMHLYMPVINLLVTLEIHRFVIDVLVCVYQALTCHSHSVHSQHLSRRLISFFKGLRIDVYRFHPHQSKHPHAFTTTRGSESRSPGAGAPQEASRMSLSSKHFLNTDINIILSIVCYS